ncbi:MAG: HAMP domain-containing histidine kinase [Clostridia bacterium]|nr:HAMP domain-containing histidine kinase [Clostridia bacterium]NLS86152.1 HAMP domain-containing histidine kinase [Oscillospiraceae bacterium]
MRKSITTRYFYATAALLLCSTAVLGFIQIYLSAGYFRETNDTSLLATIDNTITILNEYNVETSSDAESKANAASLMRDIVITARSTDNLIFFTDTNGLTLISGGTDASKYAGKTIPAPALAIAAKNGKYTSLGKLDGFFPISYYIAGKPLLNVDGAIIGYVFSAVDASGLSAYMANMMSTFILSAGLMLVVSSILSIVVTARMTTPLRNISLAAKSFGNGNFSVRVPVEGDDEAADLAVTFNDMASSLQKIDQSRQSFMGNIAHELRTPMTTIKGFIDGILDGTIPQESRQHYLEIVSQEVGRLTRLIQNMLDITKLEAGEYKVNAKLYNVWDTVSGVVFQAEQRLESKNIQIAGFKPVRTMAYADADLVYQVMQNLMDNALKFTPEDGEISFSVVPSKGTVTVSIRNSGQGISEDALPFVFDRFYKEDKSRGLNATGSGLGLHICKVLINLSGGKIWVESKEGEYCEFKFTLPSDAPLQLKAGKT